MIDIDRYHLPRSLDEVLALLNSSSRPIAGGTDLVVQMRSRRRRLDSLVDLSRILELQGIREENGDLVIGAMTTHTDICQSPLVRRRFPLLAEIAGQVGSIQIQNAGTVGGNLANASPAADVALGLLALDARARVIGPHGRREFSMDEFFVGPGSVALGEQELLLEVVVPASWAEHPAAFLKIGRRKAHPIAVTSVTAVLVSDATGSCLRASIALGAVAPVPLRASAAENSLTRAPLNEDAITCAARIAASECFPINDVRASEGYRRDMVEVLTRRVLYRILAQVRV